MGCNPKPSFLVVVFFHWPVFKKKTGTWIQIHRSLKYLYWLGLSRKQTMGKAWENGGFPWDLMGFYGMFGFSWWYNGIDHFLVGGLVSTPLNI